jgi:hypothetical protein
MFLQQEISVMKLAKNKVWPIGVSSLVVIMGVVSGYAFPDAPSK